MYYPYQFQRAPIFLPAKEAPQTQDGLKTSILLLISEFERYPMKSRAILSLSNQFKIKRRRLYDVINVFTSIGCCQKTSFDNVIWLGKERIPIELQDQAEKKDIYNPEYSLSQLFEVESSIGISNLTMCFLLLFLAQKTDKQDIRFAAHFLSRNTGRYKTTLCKLYQISYILNALGVTSRSEQVCEVVLSPNFKAAFPQLEITPEPKSDFTLIDTLLNHKSNRPESYIQSRRDEIKNSFIEGMASKDIDSTPITEPTI